MSSSVAVMTAMMLPGAVPAMVKTARSGAGARAMPRFAGSYVAVWAVASTAIAYACRLHEGTAAGAAVIAAGVYELTPLKRYFRRRCRETVRSGLQFGLCCAGSCIGLMLLPAALGVMSAGTMAAVAVLVVVQQLVPAKAALDVPLALAIVGLGVAIAIAPPAPSGFMPDM